MSSGLFWAVLPQVPPPFQNFVTRGWPDHAPNVRHPFSLPSSRVFQPDQFLLLLIQSVSQSHLFQPRRAVEMSDSDINVSTQHCIRSLKEKNVDKLEGNILRHVDAAGVVALAYPEVLYQGFGNVNAILEARGSDYAPLLLLQIVAAKILTTAVCQRSGLVGGIYAPSIFMGAQPPSLKTYHT